MDSLMDQFLTYDFNISDIVIAVFVKTGQGTPIHTDRASHGVALNMGIPKKYSFQDGTVLTVKTKELVYLPTGSSYVVSAEASGNCYAINFHISEQVNFQPFVLKPKSSSDFARLFRQAELLWKTKKQGYHMQCKSALYEILASLQQEHQLKYADKSKYNLLAPAIKYIHENYTSEQLNVVALADICRISDSYFRQIFKQAYGISPIKYINNLKLTYAGELLRSGMYTCTEAAVQAGYMDNCHFSREFKRYYGVSPREYLMSP